MSEKLFKASISVGKIVSITYQKSLNFFVVKIHGEILSNSYNAGFHKMGHSKRIVTQPKVCFRFNSNSAPLQNKILNFHKIPKKSNFLGQISQPTIHQSFSLSFHLCPLFKRDIFHPWTLIRDSKNKVAQLCQWMAQLCQ